MKARRRKDVVPRKNYLTIHHYDLGYAMLRPVVDFFFLNYYRKVEARNSKVLVNDQPIIIAPNHQNALMDALAILSNDKGQPVFLARADIFKKKTIASILHFLNIMPVYRIRDGMENLTQNDEIFMATLNILRDRHRLCLMPEGNHGNKRRLRPLVKGIFRIAFLAQKDYGEMPGVKIIPVGIDYSDYEKFQQTLFVNFGEPIEVSEYFGLWESNPAQGINALKDRLAEELSKRMIDIRTEEFYDCYQDLRTVYRPYMLERLGLPKRKLSAAFDADKEMIRCLDRELATNPDNISNLAEEMKTYMAGVRKLGIRDWLFSKSRLSFIGTCCITLFLLLGLPIFLYGLVFNALPFFLPDAIASKIKDTQFRSSVKMVLGMLMIIIFYLILFGISFFFMPWWASLIFLATLLGSGFFAFRYFIWFKKFRARLRYGRLLRKKDQHVSELRQLRHSIIEKVNFIVENHHKASNT